MNCEKTKIAQEIERVGIINEDWLKKFKLLGKFGYLTLEGLKEVLQCATNNYKFHCQRIIQEESFIQELKEEIANREKQISEFPLEDGPPRLQKK